MQDTDSLCCFSFIIIAIVTRAALKGMADSVGVFIPILQAAAENIKESVDEARKQVVEHNKNLLKNDAASHAASGMDSVSEEGEEEDQNPSTNDRLEATPSPDEAKTQQQLESSYVAPRSITQPVVARSTSATTNTNMAKTLERATPSPSVSSTTTALEKGSDISLNAPTKLQQRSKQTEQQPQQHARSGATRLVTAQPSKQRLPQQQAETATEKHWLSTIADYVPINLKTVAMFVLMGFTVYVSTMWVRSGYRMADKADEFLHHNTTPKGAFGTLLHVDQPIYLQKSTSRSVYLRDLDEGFLRNTIQPPYANSIRYLVDDAG